MNRENKNLELAKRCCLIASVIDVNFWNKYSSYKESIDSFYNSLENNDVSTVANYFSSFSQEDLCNHFRHIDEEDSLKINAEVVYNYSLVMQELNSRLSLSQSEEYACIL